MKKLIVGLVAVLLIFGGFMTWNQSKTPGGLTAAAVTPVPTPTPAATPAPPEIHTLDYEAIRALYPADTVALRVKDEELSWADYAAWLRANGLQYEDYFRQMAQYYGLAADWAGSVGDGTGRNYAQSLLDETGNTLSSFMAIHAFAKENGITLSEEQLAKLEPERLAASLCGEGATVEQLEELLEKDSHMSVELFRYYSESIALYTACYESIFGTEGEKLSEEEIIKALEEKDYLSAGHILFMTIDPMTGKELEESVIAEKLAKAEELVAELRAIPETEALLKRFAELKAEYCEDTGKTAYPDGYTFTPGTMVPEFEDTVKSLDNYAVSDPVKTSYGYHVILRLPLSAESLLSSSQGSPITARKSVAQDGIAKLFDDYFAANPAEYADGLKELDLTKYIQ